MNWFITVMFLFFYIHTISLSEGGDNTAPQWTGGYGESTDKSTDSTGFTDQTTALKKDSKDSGKAKGQLKNASKQPKKKGLKSNDAEESTTEGSHDSSDISTTEPIPGGAPSWLKAGKGKLSAKKSSKKLEAPTNTETKKAKKSAVKSKKRTGLRRSDKFTASEDGSDEPATKATETKSEENDSGSSKKGKKKKPKSNKGVKEGVKKSDKETETDPPESDETGSSSQSEQLKEMPQKKQGKKGKNAGKKDKEAITATSTPKTPKKGKNAKNNNAKVPRVSKESTENGDGNSDSEMVPGHNKTQGGKDRLCQLREARQNNINVIYASPHEFPFVVGIIERNSWKASGALITESHVLTCGSSMTMDVRMYTVLLGRHNIEHREPSCRARSVEYVVKSGEGNDLAILKLFKKVDLVNEIKVVCLGMKDTGLVGRVALAVGWQYHSRRTGASKLQKYEVEPVYCDPLDPSGVICPKDRQKNRCDIDVGAPLVIKAKDSWVMVGVGIMTNRTKFGEVDKNCKGEVFFANTGKMMAWIDSTLAQSTDWVHGCRKEI